MFDQGATGWHKSSYSDAGGNCIEKGLFSDGAVAVRDTKLDRKGDVLGFQPDAWKAFVGFAASMS